MKSVIVRYTVQSAFADTNAGNIERVMDALRDLNDVGIRYQAFSLQAVAGQEGVDFIHLGMYEDSEAVERMTRLESFKLFQAALKDSAPLSPPRSEWLECVGSSYPLFDD